MIPKQHTIIIMRNTCDAITNVNEFSMIVTILQKY
jgi:hypothetical protein